MVKPEYDLTHMEPRKGGNYTSFSECRFYCKHETGINRVQFSIWRTGEPATQVWLQYAGVDGDWEVWKYTFAQPFTEPGEYSFHYYFYANSGEYNEIPAPSILTIIPLPKINLTYLVIPMAVIGGGAGAYYAIKRRK